MIKVDLTQNFARIYRTLSDEGGKPTNLAKSLGYTTTSQLNSVLEGKSMLSSKAICAMIENLNVNPRYLFLGQGEMFMNESGEDELDELRKEISKLRILHSKAADTAMELGKRNAELIEVTSAAIKYYKSKCGEE